ncbi:MAG: acyl-CoA dehydrogenase family protein [Pseudonocardia sp.]
MDDAGETTLKAARALAPELSARAEEGEALHTMPPDLVDRVRATRLFALWRPRSLGGLELDPLTQLEIIEELSRADGSAGWTIMIGSGSSAIFAWLDPEVARDMIGDDLDSASASMFAPLGRGVPDGNGGITLSGRWPFNSGCPHAAFFQTGLFVSDGDGPRMVPPGRPDWRFAFLHRAEAEIVETWDAAGLRGTGSHDVVVRELPVPAEQLAAPMFEQARHDGPLWRIPFFTAIGVSLCGFPLGVARRALDELTALAPTKRRGSGDAVLAEDAYVQLELARAEGGLQAARAFAVDAIGDIWQTACAGDPPSLDQRLRALLAVQQSMRSAMAAVDTAFELAGAGAVYTSHPLQRCFRDIHTAKQHIVFSPDRWRRYAQHRVGIGGPTFMI